MADEQPTVETFPPPPGFYEYFTDANLERLEALKSSLADRENTQQDAGASTQQSASDIENLPDELRFLQPPEPPADGKYTCFGAPFDLHEQLQSLSAQGIDQLYPTKPAPTNAATGTESEWTLDRATYLRKIARSIMLNYLELVGVLSVDPTDFPDKIQDITTLFLNGHHLINEYRPHQARATLIHMMEEQLEQKRAEIRNVRVMKEKVRALAGTIAKETENEVQGFELKGGRSMSEEIADARNEEQRSMWEALDEHSSGWS
ncbi:mediator of RNA polymerase II transcription subunit 7 [Eremomyces bilateralis CBS 781.70]|uniref:Mediator of RNA polymerase II transcription subunit 7 n=1 Tax=Eremomyces bilateralis CBS 781.70 TaxID=1392243 RepID=A0A6G1FQU7_9PEZI|nr:mediator of RNA polymerase II transcription subunit 7 [Eremomyces bilateralis CBS 781.70]KAF1808032.1 mediator of RNA polymerase II transcription subunit 7 [Eremomyces bilateralis CBS 781.70]